MTISADSWAIVAATGLGPILAVGLTLGFTYWRETIGAKYNRRLGVTPPPQPAAVNATANG
ncbi:MAG TPA: hypothetical protein VGM32_11810 [Rhodopila sp.]|jgi:hypothetical protein